MRESSDLTFSNKKPKVQSLSSSKEASGGSLVATVPRTSTHRSIKHIDSLYQNRPGLEFAGHIALFLLKVAALELVRRFSRAKCPIIWHGVQALQVLCYPPLKWIQRWAPFRGLVMGMQQLSKPLLFLSIATAFSDQSESSDGNSNASEDSLSQSEPYIEPLVTLQAHDARLERVCDESPQRLASEYWLVQLYKELEAQNITLPERISDDELCRFYAAANGDFSRLLSSVKKTIRWRETYTILSAQELESWSQLVFWHGRDVMLRPCLFVRLGVASSSLAFHDRPRFTQAIVSQIEHGVLHLVTAEHPQITVLMDCEGLSPFNFPMQMLRSCSSLVQDHYPNRLASLFIIRLAPVVRVVAQTFIQVLNPVTRQKLRIEGETYKTVLSEYLQTIPSFLGGDCVCPQCTAHSFSGSQIHQTNETNTTELSGDFQDNGNMLSMYPSHTDAHLDNNEIDQLLKRAIIAMLMVLIFVSFIGVMYGPEGLLESFI